MTLQTVAGSAKTPADFNDVSRRLTFNPGETTKSVDIGIVDRLPEGHLGRIAEGVTIGIGLDVVVQCQRSNQSFPW